MSGASTSSSPLSTPPSSPRSTPLSSPTRRDLDSNSDPRPVLDHEALSPQQNQSAKTNPEPDAVPDTSPDISPEGEDILRNTVTNVSGSAATSGAEPRQRANKLTPESIREILDDMIEDIEDGAEMTGSRENSDGIDGRHLPKMVKMVRNLLADCTEFAEDFGYTIQDVLGFVGQAISADKRYPSVKPRRAQNPWNLWQKVAATQDLVPEEHRGRIARVKYCAAEWKEMEREVKEPFQERSRAAPRPEKDITGGVGTLKAIQADLGKKVSTLEAFGVHAIIITVDTEWVVGTKIAVTGMGAAWLQLMEFINLGQNAFAKYATCGGVAPGGSQAIFKPYHKTLFQCAYNQWKENKKSGKESTPIPPAVQKVLLALGWTDVQLNPEPAPPVVENPRRPTVADLDNIVRTSNRYRSPKDAREALAGDYLRDSLNKQLPAHEFRERLPPNLIPWAARRGIELVLPAEIPPEKFKGGHRSDDLNKKIIAAFEAQTMGFRQKPNPANESEPTQN